MKNLKSVDFINRNGKRLIVPCDNIIKFDMDGIATRKVFNDDDKTFLEFPIANSIAIELDCDGLSHPVSFFETGKLSMLMFKFMDGSNDVVYVNWGNGGFGREQVKNRYQHLFVRKNGNLRLIVAPGRAYFGEEDKKKDVES